MAEFRVDFPTLGDLADQWIEQHCRVPDRFERGKPFRQYDWQFWCTANHLRVREDAVWDPDAPPLNQAFTYRQSLIVGPQKLGKGPWFASLTACAAVGPWEFCGWAEDGDEYRCADNGCPCGWVYVYLPGEPMGTRTPSPLIQLTATSQSQVDNVYRQLVAMIALGPLKHLLAPRRNFIRVLGDDDNPDVDRIDAVTAEALSRLGNPISAAFQDETGTWTTHNGMRNVADTQRRGAAGMGGRVIQTTNAWDPAQNSVAQETYEAHEPDVFTFWRNPDESLRREDGKPLDFTKKAERAKILEYVYGGSNHVNLASIEAEAAPLAKRDLAQAERFFGNRLSSGSGAWLQMGDWPVLESWEPEPEPGTPVCVGFDGSDFDDWTALRCETLDGYQFTPRRPDGRPAIWNPKEDPSGRTPRAEVSATVARIFERFEVARMYVDPPRFETDMESWVAEHGEDRVIAWTTSRVPQMHASLERFLADLAEDRIRPDGCPITAQSMANATRLTRGTRYILTKPSNHQKIDPVMASVLAHEAAADARVAGWNPAPKRKAVFFRTTTSTDRRRRG